MCIKLLAIFFKDLSNLLVSGIGLNYSLMTLSETAADEKIRVMCVRALAALSEGSALSAALSIETRLPKEAITAIAAGERAGELSMVLKMLSDYFEMKVGIKNKICAALAYPAIVMSILMIVMCYVSVEVIPKVAGLFSPSVMASPATKLLLGIAWVLKNDGIFLIVFIVFIVLIGITLMTVQPVLWLRIVSRLPVLGLLRKEQELSLGIFALFVLCKSGVPLESSLRESARVAGGLTQIHLNECALFLVGGLSLSEAIRRDAYFPRYMADTLRVGEESGRHIEYFERIYGMFYRSFQTRLDRWTDSVEPFLLIVCAGFIALIALGFLQPLYGNLTTIANP